MQKIRSKGSDRSRKRSVPCFFNTEDQKQRIIQIIEHQKSLYWPSSSSSSASCSSSSSSHKSSSLLDLMKVGSTSLRRLFDMEHTSLATHFQDYSGSPITKPIPLWGSGTENEVHDPWASIRQIGNFSEPGPMNLVSLLLVAAGTMNLSPRMKSQRIAS
ncbi:hypothetical protein OIU84_011116 [Salix udensis]|uniref:Uncharacterized protein n=1 Tax=Salix udensis TaxID=889485 RepID=A0AAD6JNQ2_9ROSI|nr:hypothetical protein OIU84_011116 [Salix udensis]